MELFILMHSISDGISLFAKNLQESIVCSTCGILQLKITVKKKKAQVVSMETPSSVTEKNLDD